MALILFFGDTITNKFRSAKKREDDKKKTETKLRYKRRGKSSVNYKILHRSALLCVSSHKLFNFMYCYKQTVFNLFPTIQTPLI